MNEKQGIERAMNGAVYGVRCTDVVVYIILYVVHQLIVCMTSYGKF